MLTARTSKRISKRLILLLISFSWYALVGYLDNAPDSMNRPYFGLSLCADQLAVGLFIVAVPAFGKSRTKYLKMSRIMMNLLKKGGCLKFQASPLIVAELSRSESNPC